MTGPTELVKGPRGRLLTIAAGILLLLALGARPVFEYRDLNCPPGSFVRGIGVAYWAVACSVSDGPSGARKTTAPVRRYVGLFLTNVDVRVFDADLLSGATHGPALGVKLGR